MSCFNYFQGFLEADLKYSFMEGHHAQLSMKKTLFLPGYYFLMFCFLGQRSNIYLAKMYEPFLDSKPIFLS